MKKLILGIAAVLAMGVGEVMADQLVLSGETVELTENKTYNGNSGGTDDQAKSGIFVVSGQNVINTNGYNITVNNNEKFGVRMPIAAGNSLIINGTGSNLITANNNGSYGIYGATINKMNVLIDSYNNKHQ